MAKKEAKEAKPDPVDRYVRAHLAFGWWALAVFTIVGLVLEAMHGLKIGWYLDVTSSTRRLSLTLGHAHGTLLALVNIAFALRAATIALPLGFLAGGFNFYGGDPGIAIVLVPPSAGLLIIGVVTFARGFQDKSAR